MSKRFIGLWAGQGTLLIRCAEEWLKRGHEISGVVALDHATQAWAMARKLAVWNNASAVVAVDRKLCDYHFLVGYPEDAPRDFSLPPRLRCVAYQDAPWPNYAGWHTTSWALLKGETRHGTTWYVPATGDLPARILDQSELAMAAGETAFSLNAKCYDAAWDGFLRVLEQLEQGRLTEQPVAQTVSCYFTRYQRPPAACLLDFRRPAKELVHLAQALNFSNQPNPLGCPKLWLGNDVLLVQEVALVSESEVGLPGTVARVDEQGLVVMTGCGTVALRKLTNEHGKPMPMTKAADLYGWEQGHVLPLANDEMIRDNGRLHERLAPHESYWVAQLSLGQPATIPFVLPVRTTASPDIQQVKIDRLPAALLGEDAVLSQVAIHAAFLARLADMDGFSVEWQDEEIVAQASQFGPLVSSSVPLWIDPAYGDQWPPFRQRLAQELATVREHGNFMSDLVAREPALRASDLPRSTIRLSVTGRPTPLDADTVLCVHIMPMTGEVTWHYQAQALSQVHAQRLADLLAGFISNLSLHPERPWRSLPLLTVSEQRDALQKGRTTRTAYDDRHDLGEQLSSVALSQGDRVALEYQGKQWTYRAFEQRSNQLAALLKARGAGPDTCIGVLMDRSPETLIVVAGILKAGSCYVPLDPAYPGERLAYMVNQASLSLLLTQPHLEAQVPPGQHQIIVVDPGWQIVAGQADSPVHGGAGPEHLCYVIHTSGSTGRPKGVAMTRRAMLNLIHWQNTSSTPAPQGRTFQYAALSFDVSVQEMLSTWLAGGTLVLVPEETRRDPMRLLQLAIEAGLQRWFMPYAALQQVAVAAEAAQRYPMEMRDIITAGEALRITPEIRQLFTVLKSCRLHNQYGPSETHVVTAAILPPDPADWPELPGIGRAVANTDLFLLDPSGNPVPDGFPGELCLGGDGLARGYLHQPALTAERFVTMTWAGQANQLVYRTGDIARWSDDGLEFLGRRDDQVKIRGYRVELAEVEAALGRFPGVREVAVTARDRGGVRQLVAYVSAKDGTCTVKALRTHLHNLLPEYMVPSVFMFLDQLPLTPSGKIHRRALPEPTVTSESAELDTRPPQNDIERILGHLWQQVLGLDRVGMGDNFFDLGGDSLKLAKVQAALRTTLRREIPILDLFRFPTISALASQLTQAESSDNSPRFTRRTPPVREETMAVVGMAGRFPGAEQLDQWWANLCEGRESITFFNDEDLPAPPPVLPPDSTLKFIKARGVLDRCEWFDAAFFGYAPRDAELMDPQHRVFLECAYEALEHAGCDPARYSGSIGVFAAASMNTYLMYNVLADRAAVHEMMTAYQVGGYPTVIGNDKDYVATRVAYKLNLRGPSMSIQTACSSSLVAIAQACQSLAAGACDVALAGGVSITFPQQRGYLYVEGSIASSDGHCRPFDAEASGTVFGSGVGILTLKRLSDAKADGDTIYAVIKGWALNNDGAQKAGYMAPSVEGQAEVIRMAQERAGVDARSIGYVETHGTGTPLGDPIEMAGLTRAFRLSTAETGFCALGSLKANVGHMESAAGAAGLLKAVLALYHRQVPPLVHFTRANPLIDLPSTPFYVPRQLAAWPDTPEPRRAAVSSFGVGGTNAHIILEEAPPVPAVHRAEKTFHLLPWSARTDTARSTMAARLADFVEGRPAGTLSEVAYTLQMGRTALEKRAFVVVADAPDALKALRSPTAQQSGQPVAGGKPSVVFMFPGQGSQHVDMGRGLYEHEPIFRQHLDACVEVLRPLLGLDLKDLLYPDPARATASQEQLTQTRYAQPALFAIEYAVARWWMALGVQPAAMIGHSAGEFVAACLAGVFSLEDALTLLVKRAELMQSMPSGQMLAVRLPESELLPYLKRELSLAAINAPALSVASGPAEAIANLAQELESKGIGARVLQTSHAFHSHMMEPALQPFQKVAERLRYHPPSLPFVSTVTGSWITADQAQDPRHWTRQIREPVRFSPGVRELQKLPGAVFLEVGPGQALTTVTLQHDEPAAPVVAIPAMRHIREQTADYAFLLKALGRLWCCGQHVDWPALYDGIPPLRIALPTYPFERKRYWIEPPTATRSRANSNLVAASEAEAKPVECAAEPAVTAANQPDRILHEVLDILQDLSGIDRQQIIPQKPFLEMGFDSLFLTQVSLAFQRKFLVKLTLRQMLDDLSSPAAIADYLASQIPARTEPAPTVEPTVGAAAAETFALAEAGPFGPESDANKTPPPLPPPVLTRHGPYAPINKSAGDALTPKQQQHLDALIARYTARTRSSKAHTQENRAHFSDPRAVAGFRVTWKEMTYPIVSTRSAGSKIWDLDGNEYLDVTMGFGTNLFGHNPAFIRTAIEQQLGKGIEIGPQSAVAGEVARHIAALIGMDRVTFCNTGSEAVMGAVRAARTVTGRQRIVYFSGDYHGVNDEVLAKGQNRQGRSRTVPIAPGIPPDAVNQVTVLPYGEAASLETLKAEAGNLAAVLVEPVQSRRPDLQPKEFLHAVREITRQAGTALIFDEVITGFRVHPGGAQAWFGIQADIATYGKIIGGGLPIGVIAGAKLYMDAFDGGFWQYGDDSVPEAGVTFFAGTFVRHPLAMAAARAVLEHLEQQGPALQQALNERTSRFTAEINDFLTGEGVDLAIHNFGSLWYFKHGEGFKYFSLLFHFLRDQGIHIWEGRPCFLSTAHSEEDISRLVAAFKHAIHAMQEGGFLTRYTPEIPEQGPFPLTDAQQEIWLASRLDAQAAPAFNESCALTFQGRLDVSALSAALQQVVARHEALRTSLSAAGDTQQVHERAQVDLRLSDLSTLEADARDTGLAQLVKEEVSQAFDLSQVPLLRARLVRMAVDRQVLILTAHHIICDGWSYDVMARDLSELYSLACRGERDQRPRPTTFRDYARYLNRYQREARYQQDLAYWMEHLAQPPEPLSLPVDRSRPPQRTFHGAMEVGVMEASLFQDIKDMGSRQRCTLFSTLLAMYAALLHRLTGQKDLVIGIPAAGQQLMEGQDLVGHCANLLPVRLRMTPDEPFARLLAETQKALLNAYEHQGVTFGALLKELQIPRDPSRSPLIQATFNVDPALRGMQFGDLQTEIVINPRTAYQFEHSLNLVAHPDHLRIESNYNTDLFEASTVTRWVGHLREIARAVVHTPEQCLDDLPLLQEDERRVMLFEWNQTAVTYPSSCLHEVFEQQAEAHPDRVAVSMGGATISYHDLNRQANQLARQLVRLGVRPDQPVGIMSDRAPEMVMGLLGILKAGGAYMPLDPLHPPERLQLQMRDAGVRVVVAQGRHASQMEGWKADVVWLDQPASDWRKQDGENLDAAARQATHSPSQLAYVLYTSGSTGKPKGVLIEHRSVNRLVLGANYITWGPEDRMLHHSPLAFDASTLELWGPLLNGARVCLLPPGPFTFAGLAQALKQECVNKLWLTASVFHRVVDEDPDLLAPVKHLLAGGEVLSGARIARLLERRPDMIITNGYGPTESTTFAVTAEFRSGDRVDDPPPLGRPIANTQVYILDPGMKPVPVGVPGELCIGGDGLARGYLNQPELTASAFVPNPFPGTPGERLYRTGDRARYRADGRIEFLGRFDDQVKIRGFRIEPGEVEAALSTFPGLQHGAVVVRSNAQGEKQLVAYLSMLSGQPVPTVEALRQHLRQTLPDFMLPSMFVTPSSLPLTPSGKVDRQALPAPSASSSPPAGHYVAPRADLEVKIAAIWADVLGVPRVGLQDDFFALGGHSLAALKLITKLRDNGFELDVVDLFRHPTVASMVAVVKPMAPVTPVQRNEYAVRLQEGHADRPLLCLLPSDFGDLLIYTNLLPHLGPDQPCLGLQCPRMYEQNEGIRSMEELAAFFVRQLVAAQPTGPYVLAGYCFGGLVALEMAKQLRAAGKSIGLLALIDARPFRPKVARSEYLRMILNGAAKAKPADWKRHLSAKFAMAREGMMIDLMARKNPDQLSRRDLNRWVLETTVLKDYRSSEYDGPITFFYPEESQYQLYEDPSCGWLHLAERVHLYQVSGSHLNMMKDPHARMIAEQLRKSIERVKGR